MSGPFQSRPELRPVGDEQGPLARVPWITVVEIAAGLVSVVLVAHAFAHELGMPVDVADPLATTGLGVALALLVPLMLRHPMALARASRRTRIEAERARHDHLTSLPNRLAMDSALDALLARGAALTERARRGGGTRGVVRYWEGAAYLLIDLDHFKPVNDEAGHAAGDRLLVEIAALLREACGPNDIPARVGGDEFAVLMNQSDGNAARELAVAVRDALASHVFVVDGKRYPVSGSMGLIRIGPDDADADAIRAAADRGAYRAKEAGRNAIYEVTTPEDDPTLVEGGGSEQGDADGQVKARSLPTVLARRVLGLGVPDRIELSLDPGGDPPRPGLASRHVAMLGAAAALVAPNIPLAIVMPPLLGGRDLTALTRALGMVTSRRGRSDLTTILFEVPRRRGESSSMGGTVALVRAIGLPVGIVCRTHTLEGIAELAGLKLDELQLHLERSPDGALEGWKAIARAGGWRLGVRDLERRDAIAGLAGAGVERVAGPAIAAPASVNVVRASLGRPLTGDGGAEHPPIAA